MHQRKNTNGHSNSQNMYSRNSTGGYGRDVEGGRRFNDTNTNILEQQNNDRISELSEQVARLKVNKYRRRAHQNDLFYYRRTLLSIILGLTPLDLFFFTSTFNSLGLDGGYWKRSSRAKFTSGSNGRGISIDRRFASRKFGKDWHYVGHKLWKAHVLHGSIRCLCSSVFVLDDDL